MELKNSLKVFVFSDVEVLLYPHARACHMSACLFAHAPPYNSDLLTHFLAAIKLREKTKLPWHFVNDLQGRSVAGL